MNKLLVFITAVVLCCTVFAQEDLENLRTNPAPLMDPSQHVRIKYDRFNTPDSMVFEAMLALIQLRLNDKGDMELEDWVVTEMNLTNIGDTDVWLTSQVETRRHSREDIREFVDLLLDVADKSQATSLKTSQKIFCPSQKFSNMEQRFVALERWNIDSSVNAVFYLNYTMERISEQASADLTAWISRFKQGYTRTKYDFRTLWAGRESELDAKFARMCEAIEAY